MKARHFFWMAVQAVAIVGVTTAYAVDKPNEPIGVALLATIAIVAFMTSVITRAYDAIVRRWRGIPAPAPVETPPSTLGAALAERRASIEQC